MAAGVHSSTVAPERNFRGNRARVLGRARRAGRSRHRGSLGHGEHGGGDVRLHFRRREGRGSSQRRQALARDAPDLVSLDRYGRRRRARSCFRRASYAFPRRPTGGASRSRKPGSRSRSEPRFDGVVGHRLELAASTLTRWRNDGGGGLEISNGKRERKRIFLSLTETERETERKRGRERE